MPFFDGTRGQLHYRRWPVPRPVATIVLLPGMGQHSGHYHRFARMVHQESLETWALDTAGHGLSEGDQQEPGTLTELAADAAALIDRAHAAHREIPLILLGHSLGAATALGVLGLAVADDGVAAAHSGTYRDLPPEPDAAARLVSALVVSGTPSRVLGTAVATTPGTPSAPTLPVLALHGVDDRMTPFAPVELWTRRHESVSLREYIGAGHDLLHEPVHARVTADIAQWVLGVGNAAVGSVGTE